MRISDWSSDVCSSDLEIGDDLVEPLACRVHIGAGTHDHLDHEDAELRERLVVGADLDRELFLAHELIGETRRIEPTEQIGRATCRERVCQYVWSSGVAGSLKKTNMNTYSNIPV